MSNTLSNTLSDTLSEAVRHNLKLLGIPDGQSEPVIDCRCTVSSRRVQSANGSTLPGLGMTAYMNLPSVGFQSAFSFPSSSSTQKALESQFIQGLKTIPDNLPVYPELPGNAPFVLPAGITPDIVVSSQ